MKTKAAIHIAEHLWEDTIADGSLFDSFVKLTPHIEKLQKMGQLDKINDEVNNMKAEIIARWANIIMETEGHDE